MQPRVRKALGAFALILYLCAYIVFAIWLGDLLLGRAPAWMQLIYFAVAGIVWVFPLRPLFTWMNKTPS